MSLKNPIPARTALTTLAAAAAFAGGAAHAATFTALSPRAVATATAPAGTAPTAGTDLVVGLTGISSYDQQGAAVNTVLTLDALPGATVDLVTWRFDLGTVGASWLSEAMLRITNADGYGVEFNPGDGDDLPGTSSYDSGGSLLLAGTSFNVLADGKLYLEFYETWDDASGAADAVYLSGSLTLGAIAAAVPEPSAYGLLGLGLCGVALTVRRRRRQA